VQVKNKRERSSSVRPPGVEKTSRLCSRDPVASGVKCGPHGGMNSKMKTWTVSWLSLKTKVEPGLRGRRVMSEIGGGYTEFVGFPVVHQKTTRFLGWSTEPRPKNRRRCCSSADRSDRSDRWVLV
jgi:hypothetical protein